RYRRELGRIYEEVARETGRAEVGFIRFWERAKILFPGPASPESIVRAVAEEARRRWWEIADAPPGANRVRLVSRAVADRVHAAFEAAGPGWPSAKHHSPDLMIAARDPAAIARGDYQLVLGELHTSINTVTNPFVVKEHADPEAL